MFVPENKPKLYVKGLEVDNVSADGKVFFLEDGHKYYHIDDITNNKLVNFNASKYRFRSPTGILARFKEHFDAEAVSIQYVKKHRLEISPEELRDSWSEKGRVASDRGSKLHAYCESIYDGWDFGEVPQEPQARQAEKAIKKLKSMKWRLARTELLVYNTKLRVAGQVDLLLKRKVKGELQLGIFDYKFLKEPIQKKSFYNHRTRKYKMMTGPFKYLMDSNYYHYSIQMELYRMLMSKKNRIKVTHKVLVVMTEDGFSLVKGYPMRIWVDSDGILQAKYKKWNGEIYNSSYDEEYNRYEPYKVI